jgi:AcrR family transcriptional regulator
MERTAGRAKTGKRAFKYSDRYDGSVSTAGDPRTLRTRGLLEKALVSLLAERAYDRISVQDLVERSGIRRATFYLHFSEKNDLLGHMIHKVSEELLVTLIPPAQRQTFDRKRSVRRYTELLAHIRKHALLYRTLFCDPDASPFAHQIIKIIEDISLKGIRTISSRDVASDPRRMKVIARFGAAGLVGILKFWLEDGMRIPIAVVAGEITDLMSGGPMVMAGYLPVTKAAAAKEARKR